MKRSKHLLARFASNRDSNRPDLRRDVLTGLTDAERAILADAAKGRAAEATEREDGNTKRARTMYSSHSNQT